MSANRLLAVQNIESAYVCFSLLAEISVKNPDSPLIGQSYPTIQRYIAAANSTRLRSP